MGKQIDDEDLGKRLVHMHPVIRKCMHAYHQKFCGRMMLKKILTAMNMDESHLPKLDSGNGKCDACYFESMGYCGRKHVTGKDGYRFKHIKDMSTLSDKFPETLCSLIAPGLEYVIKNEPATPPRQRYKRGRE